MQHITDTQTILDEARKTDGRKLHLDIIDVSQAWARLTPIQFDPVSLQRHNVVTENPNEMGAPFDQLRTRIIRQMAVKGHRKLAISSATRGCGSSTIVANLALSFARHSDMRVMVIDLDLRAPSLIHIFGLKDKGPRFSALTGHRRNFDSTCLRFGDGLGLSLNGSPVDCAAEHLSSQKTASLMEHIETDFNPDLILFDLPALGRGDEAMAGLALADCALLVAHADRSTVEDVDWGERQVAEICDPLGVILNKCRFADVPGRSDHG